MIAFLLRSFFGLGLSLCFYRSGGGDVCSLPVFLDDIEIFLVETFLEEKLDDLVNTLSVVKRCDQRLHDRSRAVECTSIAPAFEVVLFGNVPLALLCRLIEIQPKMERASRLVYRVHAIRRHLEVSGCIVNRISAKDDKHLDLSAIDIGDQLTKLLDLCLVGVRRERIGVNNCLADIP